MYLNFRLVDQGDTTDNLPLTLYPSKKQTSSSPRVRMGGSLEDDVICLSDSNGTSKPCEDPQR